MAHRIQIMAFGRFEPDRYARLVKRPSVDMGFSDRLQHLLDERRPNVFDIDGRRVRPTFGRHQNDEIGQSVTRIFQRVRQTDPDASLRRLRRLDLDEQRQARRREVRRHIASVDGRKLHQTIPAVLVVVHRLHDRARHIAQPGDDAFRSFGLARREDPAERRTRGHAGAGR
ncbi:hypothetical protein [Brevundimonas sp.]|uniref:hypothetical protein n=1 Tax=Brevundimonas sp. TaxID=1871086 RepID=UPI00289C5E97|nr:hypothetical protein [Brevundimonas sp.]